MDAHEVLGEVAGLPAGYREISSPLFGENSVRLKNNLQT